MESFEVDENWPLLYANGKGIDISSIPTDYDSKQEELYQNSSALPPPKQIKCKYGSIAYNTNQKVSYMEHGSISSGIIVFYFASTNFTHKACPDTTGVLNRLNVRLITIDRPGYGDSTLLANYNDTPLLFAKNTFNHVLAHFLSEHHEQKQFFFLGHQTGCIYALSIAHLYPQHITEIALICPPTPLYNGPSYTLQQNKEYVMQKYCSLYCLSCVFCCYYRPKIKANFETSTNYLAFCQQMAMQQQSEDFKYIKRNKQFLQAQWKAMYVESKAVQTNKPKAKQCLNMSEDDKAWNEWFVLKATNWGFPLQSIKSKVHLWYGSKDGMSPYSAWYLDVLQNVVAHKMEGYGHLLIYPKFDQIIANMIHIDL